MSFWPKTLINRLARTIEPEPARSVSETVSAFQACVAFVLAEEGGFVNDARDNGGATNMGITKAALEHFRGKSVSVEQVRALSPEEARRIYRLNYWNSVQGDFLPPGVDIAVFDAAVNSGPGRAARWLQRCLPLTEVDGAIGPRTLAALAKVNDHKGLVENYCDLRRQYLRSLDDWQHFGRGWAARVDRVEERALQRLARS